MDAQYDRCVFDGRDARLPRRVKRYPRTSRENVQYLRPRLSRRKRAPAGRQGEALLAAVYREVGGPQTSRMRFGKASPARLCRAKVAYCVSGVSLGLISTSVAPFSSAS